MSSPEEQQRAPALCKECDSVYTVRILAGGEIEPIGTTACSCGSEEFEVVD
ncbi:hypothetical protein [Natrononativus amylolyticus]|uniref:hypothetical protein n=1 Tax=Natrononativus amylolyticus TaxID=2963434 RepID=UPI0020CE4FC0|nr:hypothetical protein [Natrononativus amylolyticus]